MSNYWESRYMSGGNSGMGSYGEYAMHKADVINKYILKYDIKTISDFGCGDGNQISLLTNYESYVGYDISSSAIRICRERFKDYSKMSFCTDISELPEADLCLSLDVLYHIIDEKEFEFYLSELFKKSKKYVLIFSSNHDQKSEVSHIYFRKFTDWIDINKAEFKLIEVTDNFLQTSAQFFLFKRI